MHQTLELDNRKQIKFFKKIFPPIFVPIENILHQKIIYMRTYISNWNYQVTKFQNLWILLSFD